MPRCAKSRQLEARDWEDDEQGMARRTSRSSRELEARRLQAEIAKVKAETRRTEIRLKQLRLQRGITGKLDDERRQEQQTRPEGLKVEGNRDFGDKTSSSGNKPWVESDRPRESLELEKARLRSELAKIKSEAEVRIAKAKARRAEIESETRRAEIELEQLKLWLGITGKLDDTRRQERQTQPEGLRVEGNRDLGDRTSSSGNKLRVEWDRPRKTDRQKRGCPDRL
ncbi:uncharacterized protein [Centruroides vittatus]|uniref:uncharacterized protein n=1 Tax=Centruroides vittatus TaxID=120091 RepID=UPI00350FE956